MVTLVRMDKCYHRCLCCVERALQVCSCAIAEVCICGVHLVSHGGEQTTQERCERPFSFPPLSLHFSPLTLSFQERALINSIGVATSPSASSSSTPLTVALPRPLFLPPIHLRCLPHPLAPHPPSLLPRIPSHLASFTGLARSLSSHSLTLRPITPQPVLLWCMEIAPSSHPTRPIQSGRRTGSVSSSSEHGSIHQNGSGSLMPTDQTRPRSSSSSKALLTRALLEAQNAVQLDNENEIPGALEAYRRAVALLSRVMEVSSSPEEHERLRTIVSGNELCPWTSRG